LLVLGIKDRHILNASVLNEDTASFCVAIGNVCLSIPKIAIGPNYQLGFFADSSFEYVDEGSSVGFATINVFVRRAVCGLTVILVDSSVEDFANFAEWAHDVKLADVDGDRCALNARVSHVSEHAELVGDNIRVDV